MDETIQKSIDLLNRSAWDKALGNPNEALAEANAALADSRTHGYVAGVADALLTAGWCLFYLSRYAESLKTFEEAETAYERSGDRLGACKVLNALGCYYQDLSRLDKAIDYYTRSLEIAKREGFDEREAIALCNIGDLCLEIGNPKEALDYLIKAYEIDVPSRSPETTANILLNIGTCFYVLENLTLAGEFVRKALDTSEGTGELLIAADCQAALGRIDQRESRLDDAEARYRAALALTDATGNVRKSGEFLVDLGSVLLERGSGDEAKAVLAKATALCLEAKAKRNLYRAYEQLSKAHERAGEDKEALRYYRDFARYLSEVQNEDAAQKIRNIQVQYEVEKARKEAEIVRLRNIELKSKTEELETSNRHIAAISDIGKRITASLLYETVVETLNKALSEYMSFDAFGVALHEEERGELVFKTMYEDDVRHVNHRIKTNRKNSFAVWAFSHRQPVLISDKDAEYSNYIPERPRVFGSAMQSIAIHPLSVEGRSIGVLMIQSREKNAYSPEDLQFLAALAPYVAIAIDNALAHNSLNVLNRALEGKTKRLEQATKRIIHLANHDTLTGLPNRRLLFELFGSSVEISRRSGAKIGVLYLDLDNFKPINDLYGHTMGDLALIAMAERLRSVLRASDLIARVGGDEFIAILMNVRDRDDVTRVAEKIREEGKRPLVFAGHSHPVGVSMGISIYPDDGSSIDELITLADAAMYRVKRSSRNGYRFASDAFPPETVRN